MLHNLASEMFRDREFGIDIETFDGNPKGILGSYFFFLKVSTL